MRYFIRTFGCQMNEHDSRKISLLLDGLGGDAATRPDEADLILFNTCTIRDKAQQRAISEIGRTARIKRRRPGLLVGVCGCVAQQEKEALFSRFAHIDLLFGPDQISALPDLLEAVRTERRQVAALDLVNLPEKYRFLDMVPWGTTSPATAYVTIMKGGDSRCAYCIVPKVRGTEVNRPADEIVAEVAALAHRGVKEVTLLGQTVNSYGKKRQPGVVSFAALLQRLAEETSIARIRFTSPHPKDVDTALVNAYRDNPRLCRHIHLPLQSGSDMVLRAMRRAYSRRQYLAKVSALRTACPDIAISTDIIVGFPGETDADFAQTIAMFREVGFEGLYAFAYSPRPGTESFARMADDVPRPVKDERLQELLALHNRQRQRQLSTLIGTVQEILVEGPSGTAAPPSAPLRAGNPSQYMGRTTQNRIVHFPADCTDVGLIRAVRITRSFAHSLAGEVIDLPGKAWENATDDDTDTGGDEGDRTHNRSLHEHADNHPQGS
ncbi:MAG: tRNA (N6-isopentenyl adenosine(37)-C2)-methylthiotransferase MiaB [Deltaproteobacteria bacterium]|nr:tRNA (N6-isopentenyl adenosine(37)-C2)-methylthiotransferase MiaB [Deltaproteobacteria bacterium]